MTDASGMLPPRTGLAAMLHRFVHIEPAEFRAVLWSFACFFSVLCAYYIIRPLRDEMGVTITKSGGSLEWLFVLVFIVMLAAVPVFGWVVANFARRRVAPVVYSFFIVNLGLFWLLLQGTPGGLTASAFFVWVSVFNLFVVSRSGDLSAVAPFRYICLLTAVVLGWVFWGHVPNALAWVGIALVIGAGLVLLRQGRSGR